VRDVDHSTCSSVCDEAPKRDLMRQEAPYPTALDALIRKLEYRAGWNFTLTDLDRDQGSKGLTLIITVATVNSYPPHEPLHVAHYMPVPPAAYDERSWRRWLLEQILFVERHEACEFFTIDGNKPYAPSHGFGQDPYLIREIGTDEDRRMSFRNELDA
jgi:hypothetical protein